MTRDEINLFSYLHILLRWKWFLLINLFLIAVVTAVITLMIPNTFKSMASVIPPKQEAGLGGALNQIAKDIIPTGLLGKSSVPQGAYNYLAILESRRTMEKVVKEFDLIKVYKITNGSMERAVKMLAGASFFDIEKNGNITVSVWDESPKRAADMANYFVSVLNEISIELSTQEATNNRVFLEKRYDQAKADMRSIEDSLRTFQERYGIYSLPDQVKGAIEEAAQLRAQAAISEVELGVLERSYGKDNPQTRIKRSEIEELNQKIRAMTFGSAEASHQKDLSFFIPFKMVPELGMRYLRLYRDFEIQNRILQFVIPIYEQARVDEQKNIPVVLVLDRALPPERKDGPKRALIILSICLVMATLFSVFILLSESFLARRHRQTPLELSIRKKIRALKKLYRIPSLSGDETPDAV